MQGKYVMTKRGPILFTETFAHSDFRYEGPTSAGRFLFYHDHDEGISVSVFGESITLQLKPDESDAERIKRAFSV